jgi:FO synthase
MNESISRAAGASHGQELGPQAMEELIRTAGRTPMQRNTMYRPSQVQQQVASFAAAPLTDVLNRPAGKHIRITAASPLAPAPACAL